MTSDSITLPFNRFAVGLRCVWSVTRKADHPLACKWVAGELHSRCRSACLPVRGSSVITPEFESIRDLMNSPHC
jgi:hypothetical protein